MRASWPAALAFVSLALCVASTSFSCRPPSSQPTITPRIEVRRPGDALEFAVIGDFGLAGEPEKEVAALVAQWSPTVVITLGDNNYPDGHADTIDQNVGQYYQEFISPYHGRFGAGGEINRFFPTPGNHDWRAAELAPYREYFTLPGNERYYDFVWGPVHFFALDSDNAEPDGNTPKSVQGRWLQQALEASDAPWRIVYMHHAPYSSGSNGSNPVMQWPFVAWGADVVMAGHDHHYERILRDGGLYIVNGLGGNPKRYAIGRPVKGSKVSFNEAHGAMRGHATPTQLELEFVRADGVVIDTMKLQKPLATGAPAAAAPESSAPVVPAPSAPETYDN